MKVRMTPLTTLLAAFIAVAGFAQEQAATNGVPVHQATPDSGVLPSKFTDPKTLAPEESNGEIARLAARMIERSHFLRKEFDDSLSEKFFERYIEYLDPQRMYFLQGDYEEFSVLKKQLDDFTLRRGDTRPAYDIFNRYLQRIDEQYATVQNQLKNGKFSFEEQQRILLNRKDAPRPKDLDEAKKLWADRLRFEYLTEKLGRDFSTLATNVWTKITTASDPEEETAVPVAATPGDAPSEPAKPVVAAPKAEPVIKPVMVDGKQVAELHLTGLEPRLRSLLSTNRAAEITRLVEAGKFKSVSDVREYIEANMPEERHEEIVKTLTRRYNRVLRNLKQFEPKEVLQAYLDALAHSYDPHSNYFGAREEEAFNMSMTLSFVGIGAVLTSEDGYAVITEVKPGSPAEKSKVIKAGDKIVAVAQDKQAPVDVIDEKLQNVVEKIRGPKGSKVTLTIIPTGADSSTRKAVTIVRDVIPLEDQEAKAKLVLLPDSAGRTNRIGIIDLPAFYSGAIGGNGATKSPTADVAKLLKKLMAEKVDGVVLDLRRNGGGSLEECVSLTGLFIKEGPVVQVVNSLGQHRVLADDDSDVLYDGPLVVLTSRLSASASEILAGALQDYGRAIVVGDSSTHGKGTVQNLQALDPYYRGPGKPGQVKVTISKFFRPSGSSTQLKGVVPDIVLPSVNNYADIGEASLSNALPWNTIAPVRFEKLDRVPRFLPELQHRSEDRVAKDRDFAYIREDIERYKKLIADRTISLNEKARHDELAADKLRAALRKEEIKSRNEREPLTYEITLKNASQAGLPEPKSSKPLIAATKRDERALKSGGTRESSTAEARRREREHQEGEEPDEDEEGVAADVNMREAERILIDYVQLSGGRQGVASTLPATSGDSKVQQ
jgi:carboxyl-terminal processing protease